MAPLAIAVVAALSVLLTAGCSDDDATTSATTATTAAPSTTRVTRPPSTSTTAAPCDDAPAEAGTADEVVATADVDGDGQPDDLRSARAEDGWHLRVQLHRGGGADLLVETFPGDTVRVLGGADVDGDGAAEVWARTGSGASAAIVGLFRFTDCALARVTLADGGPADFAVGGSVGTVAGLECAARADRTAHLTSYAGSSSDGRTYDVVATEHALEAGVLVERGSATSSVAVSDPAFDRVTRFSCGSLGL